MATIINRKQDILDKLQAEGKVRICNSEEHHLANKRINEHVKKVRREFLIKQARSWQSAANMFLTC